MVYGRLLSATALGDAAAGSELDENNSPSSSGWDTHRALRAKRRGFAVEVVGDAFLPRSLQHAILEGHTYGRRV